MMENIFNLALGHMIYNATHIIVVWLKKSTKIVQFNESDKWNASSPDDHKHETLSCEFLQSLTFHILYIIS